MDTDEIGSRGRLAKVGVLVTPARNTSDIIDTVRKWTTSRRAELIEFAPVSRGNEVPKVEGLNVLIAIGGDGVVLHALRAAIDTQVPVLSVAFGHLGYLAHIDPVDLVRVLDELDRGQHDHAELPALEVSFPEGAGSEKGRAVALNDVVVSRQHGAGQALIAVNISGSPFTRLSIDALVMSTPLGSTAYNLSAGGPIVSPDIDLLLITPVAPAGFFDRTTAVAAGDHVSLMVLPGSAPTILECDGQVVATLREGQTIAVALSSARTRIIRLEGTNFYSRVVQRLGVPIAPVLDSHGNNLG